ncbi:hypothetical protein BESB_018590 [Besnoitia besnoiti]|uniref:MIP18 family-like domain-containing protein n=1 Tax=Besnoitia besnoiti TaxID=94643 RepID=A0A2A9M8C3_BESBE|nr:hypothetical protein BESB_018590 [Besnoitia besnoiti]PFH32541.1 hypothetical protein BESB_018590 [Besnoitia besnoiti]
MENPNPTVLEDRGESDEEFVLPPDAAEGYPSTRTRLASLFSSSTRKANWVCSLSNPNIFYFPLLLSSPSDEGSPDVEARHRIRPGKNSARASWDERSSPSQRPGAAHSKASALQALAGIAGGGGRGSAGQRKRDVLQQIQDFISLLKSEGQVRDLLEKHADGLGTHSGRARQSAPRRRQQWREDGRRGSEGAGATGRGEKPDCREQGETPVGEVRDEEGVVRRRVNVAWRKRRHLRRRLRARDPITVEEVYSYIRHIQDPEHPYSLEQLGVVAPDRLTVNAGEDDFSDMGVSSFEFSADSQVEGAGRWAEGRSRRRARRARQGRVLKDGADGLSISESYCGSDASASSLSSEEIDAHVELEVLEALFLGRGSSHSQARRAQSCSPSVSQFSLSASSDSPPAPGDSSRAGESDGRRGAQKTRRGVEASCEVRAMELAHRGGRRRQSDVAVSFHPTIPHCSQATLIGLLVLVKLLRSLPVWMKAEVRIIEGKHVSFKTINRQLKDKERVSAAVENPALFKVLNRGLIETDAWMDVTDLLLLPE